MAKNINERKKRVAHYKNAFDENDFIGCHDFVSSIIEDMDNFTSTCLSNLPRVQQNDVLKNHFPSTSHTQLQNSGVPKPKNFCLSKKFPLMEKTQKTLKQIRHNRKMPKPRAHLSKMSPLRKSYIILGNSTEKLKRKIALKNTAKSQSKNELQKPVHIVKAQCSNNEPTPCTSKSSQNIKEPCKKSDSYTVKSKCNVKDSSSSKDIIYKTDDNSSDSEYESFIKKAKKDLPKKHKKQKSCSRKVKIPKKSTKKVIKKNNSLEAAKSIPGPNEIMEYDSGVSDVASTSSLPYESNKKIKESQKVCDEITMDYNESDFSDTTSASSLPYYRRSKRVKNCQRYGENEIFIASDLNDSVSTSPLPYYRRSKKVENSKKELGNEICTVSLNYNNEFEVESCQGENYTRDSSSESENDGESNLDNTCDSQHIEEKKMENNLSQMHSLTANNNASSSSNICSEYKPLDICKNDKNCSSSLEQGNPSLSDSYVVDLTESDNECENATTAFSTALLKEKEGKADVSANLNENAQSSEESDLEIIDIVIASTIATKCNIAGLSCESSLGLKTEKVDCFVKTEIQSIAQPVEKCQIQTDKFEATYVTNICTGNSRNIPSLSIQPYTGENIDENVQSREVKKEVYDDDDIIIIDTTPSPDQRNASCSQNVNNTNKEKMAHTPVDIKQALNNSCKQMPNSNISCDLNIKNRENYASNSITNRENKTLVAEKELKLFEIACSNLKMQNKMPNEAVHIQDKDINSMGPVDPKVLVQSLKKELEAYERILQAEKSVGATFKYLENKQAEKLTSLKSMISACLKNSAANCNNTKIIKSEVVSLLDSPNLNRSRTFDNSSSTSNEVISRDFGSAPTPELQAPFSNINLVPLSSISENDIKPNLSELEEKLYSLQKSTPSEKTALTFGETCVICGKGALAACQQCAKVFFCSNECGKKYWDDGHRNECSRQITE